MQPGQNEPGRFMYYQCISCEKLFPSSQAIAGHSKRHFKNGWVKGTRHRNVFLQEGSTPDSSIPWHQQQQEVCSTVASDTESTNVQHLSKGDHGQNFENSVARPPSSPASSSAYRRHRLGVRDHKILARLKGRLTKEEDDTIMLLVEIAKKQAKESSKKSIEMEVIPNKDSEAAPMIRIDNKDIIIVEDSDDESNNIRS
ncbi:uncharacterized protein LOC132622416 [Lycium barbarum]|uniref:uncharacterized protein LOC132622416 n=1 Tax=Lycium barbarum TaxID=112863 RepID=UPI00293F1054|nr:uncharacterized protein LOC132622416 [Lycium barbarum]